MDLEAYRESESEVHRTADIVRMFPRIDGGNALDVGARDGHFSNILAQTYSSVTALDLQQPTLNHPRIQCVSGDVTKLEYADNAFDLVVCTEVLEHIPAQLLHNACTELSRVSRKYLLIGVPFRQDVRVGRTTCSDCGTFNPPWGHVNVFDEKRLRSLFSDLKVEELSFVGVDRESTNGLSTFLMDIAGNPYGTYEQEEPCVSCGARLHPPPQRTLFQRVCTRAALVTRYLTQSFRGPHPYWIHFLFRKG